MIWIDKDFKKIAELDWDDIVSPKPNFWKRLLLTPINKLWKVWRRSNEA